MTETATWPVPLSWQARVGTVPALTGPASTWKDQLLAVLNHLAERGVVDKSETVLVDGVSDPVEFAKFADQVAPVGLVSRGRGTISLGETGSAWLQDPTDARLVAAMHSRARFVGEALLEYASGPKTVAELLASARSTYRLNWQSPDQIRRRLKWLTLLGFVEEFADYSSRITPAGRALVGELQLADPSALWVPERGAARVPAEHPGPHIEAAIARLSESNEHEGRRTRLTYIPANADSSPYESLLTLVRASSPSISGVDFDAFTRDTFNLKASSARSVLSTLRAAGLIVAVGRDEFAPTAEAHEWSESENPSDLVRILHCNVRFVGELLALVDEAKRAPALARLGDEFYGIGSAADTVGRVLQLLKHAGLVQEIAYARYATTQIGQVLLEELPLAPRLGENADAAPADDAHPSPDAFSSLADEVVAAAIDSSQPRRFEEAVASVFRELGAQATVIGGAGDTDVLVEIGVASSTRFSAVVDAKSSAAGQVGEGAINLQAINDHKRKHGAQHAAIVAPKFVDGRIRTWAAEQGIALLAVDDVLTLLESHHRTPLSTEDLGSIFEADGLTRLGQRLEQRRQRRNLLGVIVAALWREAQEDDPVVGASLDVTGIYRTLRDQLESRAAIEDIRSAVEFLSSPLLGILGSDKHGYFLLDPPATAAKKLASLSDSIAQANEQDN